MEKSQFSEHQIITILKSVETGRTAKDVCREHGISNATFYAWKSKFGGMEAADIKRTRDLEHENARLKQMYAELSGKSGLAGCDRKKALKPAEKREVVLFVQEEHGLSVSRVCTALRMSRSVFVYKPTPRDDTPVVTALLEMPNAIHDINSPITLSCCIVKGIHGTINTSTGFIGNCS